MQFPIKLIANNSSGFISGTSANIDLTPSIQNQYGTLNWKFYYYATNFTLYDYTVANGEEDKIKILSKKIKGSMADAYRELSSASWGSSTSDSLLYEGITDMIAASGTSYAGLTDTDYTDTTAYLPHISTATVVSYANINAIVNTIRGRVQSTEYDPSKIWGFMNPATFSKYQAAVQNQQLFIDDKNLFATGFVGFKVNGVEFYLDAYVPGTQDGSTGDNYLVIMPMDSVKFHYKFGFDNPSPFDSSELRIPNQPILTTQNFIVGNWVASNRRLIGCTKTLVA